MSGTSMDAIDAALCRLDGERWSGVAATHSQPYPADVRSELLSLQLAPDTPRPLRDWARLDEAVARCFADAAKALIQTAGATAADVAAIGSHGQTVFHDPRSTGSSWQLGSPSRIAAITGITTVADFRRADIAHGGEGAPLVPAFHRAVFLNPEEPRCVLNIGGIANVTVLHAGSDQAKGFDTGPGNALMDSWCWQHLRRTYDEDGQWAATGVLCTPLLKALLSDPYFSEPPPKSTGRDRFNLDWVHSRYARLNAVSAADVQRTLCEVTAASIAAAICEHAPQARRILACGGGVRNHFLMKRLAALLPSAALETTDAHGLDGRWVEAAAFAWLASRTLDGLPGNLPSATGAKRPAILGGIYRA